MTRQRPPRNGAAVIEAAFVLPVVIFFLLAIIVGAMGVFRYQEVCLLAREAARYASVRGTDYAREMQRPAATPQDVFDNAIKPRVMTLETARLTYSVTWDQENAPATLTTDPAKPRGNTVIVTVRYSWHPEALLIGPFTLTASSTLPMTY